MKRLLFISFAVAVLMCGCNKSDAEPVSTQSSNIVENSESSAVVETQEPTLAERDRTVDTSKEFVFDDAGVLSSAEYKALNERAAWLTKTFKTNISVVIADNIGEKSAKEYAEEYYKEFYGNSNGIMFLVNNDTGNDYILKKGAPSLFIENSSVEMLFTEISPMLVTGNYNDAITRTLEFLEMHLPEYAIDRTNKMNREDILAVNEIISAACGENESISLIFTRNIGEKSVEEYAKEQAGKYFDEGCDSVLMTINTDNGECYICGQGSFEEIEKNQKNVYELISGLVVENDDENSFDYDGAADIFVKFIGR